MKHLSIEQSNYEVMKRENARNDKLGVRRNVDDVVQSTNLPNECLLKLKFNYCGISLCISVTADDWHFFHLASIVNGVLLSRV
jgi:hypothetical protein